MFEIIMVLLKYILMKDILFKDPKEEIKHNLNELG